MLTIFDRYLVREILLPFCLALLILTFILLMPPILENAQQLIAKGVDFPTVFRILLTLTPQALAVTIPMALLYGILMGLGRLSADREFVALQACGVSVFRALRPIALLAGLAFAADQYVLLVALPNANQTFREITFNVVASKAESDVKPRTFYQGFPNRVVYVRDVTPQAGWRDVFLADTTRAGETSVYFAAGGRLLVDHDRRSVQLVLTDGTLHTTFAAQPERYDVSSFDRLVLNMEADSVFKRTQLLKGDNEMTIAELRAEIDKRRAQGIPVAMQLFTIQQKFSIPVSCLVLAVVALAFGASSRKDGTLASFALGSGVIFVYYIFMYMARAAANGGRMSPSLAPWVPNVAVGIAGIALLVWRAQASGESIRISLPRWLTRTAPAERTASRGAAPARRDRVVLVVRIPQLHLPRPSLLDLYIARRYVSVFVVTFFSLMGIFYIATFIDLADKLFRGSTTGAMLLQFFFFQTPQYVYYVIPLGALLATLVTVGVLTKNSELIVMRACGVSLYRSALPLVVFSLVLSGLLYELQERVLADSNREAKRLEGIIRGWPSQTFSGVLSRRWIVGQNGDLYFYEYFDPQRKQFDRFSIFHPGAEDWRLNGVTFARHVAYVRDGGRSVWRARDGWTREFGTARKADDAAVPAVEYEPFDEQRLSLEPPSYFSADMPDAERMTYDELRSYVTQLQKSGYYAVPYQVQLQRKVAFPLVTLIMTMLAVPFAVTTGRRGALYGVGIGIVMAIVYWTAQSMFGAMGAAGLLSPAVAAWAPNVLFAAAASYGLLTVRT